MGTEEGGWRKGYVNELHILIKVFEKKIHEKEVGRKEPENLMRETLNLFHLT